MVSMYSQRSFGFAWGTLFGVSCTMACVMAIIGSYPMAAPFVALGIGFVAANWWFSRMYP